MNASKVNHTIRRGSALIAVYWAIALLSLAVFTTVSLLFGEVESRASQGQLFRAKQLAEMGLAVAANPEVEPGDNILFAQVSELESYKAIIESEAGRLNLNATLAREDLEVLQRLFILWGLVEEESVALSEALLDWIDPDDEVTGLGAEFPFYESIGRPDLPRNGQFLSLDEVMQVQGFNQVARVNPNWRSAFTLWGNGKLDLADAMPDVIAAACDCSLAAAETFVLQRRGSDGLENTQDDVVYEAVEDILAELGAPASDLEMVRNRVGLGGRTVRLRSTGRVDDLAVRLVAVINNRGRQMSLLEMRQQVYRIPRETQP